MQTITISSKSVDQSEPVEEKIVYAALKKMKDDGTTYLTTGKAAFRDIRTRCAVEQRHTCTGRLEEKQVRRTHAVSTNSSLMRAYTPREREL